MGVDSDGWVLVGVGVVAGVCLALLSGAVRDVVLDMVDQVVGWWWDLVDAVRRVLLWAGAVVVGVLALWAVVALVLPRFVVE